MTTNKTTIYDSIRAAGRALDIKKKTFFFNFWLFKNLILILNFINNGNIECDIM